MFNRRQTLWDGGKSQEPLSLGRQWEKTKLMKPTDKAIVRMVSESPGCNESEPRSGLERK